MPCEFVFLLGLFVSASMGDPQGDAGGLSTNRRKKGLVSFLLALQPELATFPHHVSVAKSGLHLRSLDRSHLATAQMRSEVPIILPSSQRAPPILNTTFTLPHEKLRNRQRHQEIRMIEEHRENASISGVSADAKKTSDASDDLKQRTAGLRACIGAACGGLPVGFNSGVIAGALLFIVPEFGLESRPQITGLIASSTTMGAILGTVASGRLSDRFGRRYPLLLSSLMFMFCGVLMACAPTARALIGARFLGGISAGVVAAVVPTYIAECAEASDRGKLSALPQLCCSSGILLSYIVGLISLTCGASWRLMLGVSIVPAAIQGLIVYFLPESPRWLISQKNDSEKALASLRRLRGKEDVTAELRSIKAGLSREKDTGDGVRANDERIGLIGLLRDTRTRRTLFVCLALQFFQQFCGVNAIVYFTPQILKQAGVPSLFLKYGLSADAAAMLATVCAYVPKIPSAVLAGYLLDRLGRRWMLKVCIPPLGACLALLGWTLGTTTTAFSAKLATLAVTFFGILFTMSLGPLPTLLTSELFPTSARSSGVAAATTVQFLCNVLVAQLFPIAAATYGMRSVVYFFSLVCVIAWFVVLKYVPETKGRALEDIDGEAPTTDLRI